MKDILIVFVGNETFTYAKKPNEEFHVTFGNPSISRSFDDEEEATEFFIKLVGEAHIKQADPRCLEILNLRKQFSKKKG